jgi:acetyl-CoA carboxylase carboxyltransferase component
MADLNYKTGEEDELNSSSEELNTSQEEVDKEMTEEEAKLAREQRRLRREKLKQLLMDPSILYEPDEPASPYRTRAASSGETTKAAMEVTAAGEESGAACRAAAAT